MTIILLIIIGIFVYIKYLHYQKRCSSCGKWNAMKIIDKKVVSRDETSVKKTVKDVHKNRNDEIIETVEREVYIPGIKEKTAIIARCKFCNAEDTTYETKEYAK